MASKTLRSTTVIDRWSRPWTWDLCLRHRGEGQCDLLQARQDMRFTTSQGRKSQRGKVTLHVAHVVLAQGKIVNQIAGARSLRWGHRSELLSVICFCRAEVAVQMIDGRHDLHEVLPASRCRLLLSCLHGGDRGSLLKESVVLRTKALRPQERPQAEVCVVPMEYLYIIG
jgi:hypothetical protein